MFAVLLVAVGLPAALGGLVAVLALAALIGYEVAGGRALGDFIDSYVGDREFERVRMYRLPRVTPLVSEGRPAYFPGIGYPSYAFEGPLDGSRRVLHARTELYRTIDPRKITESTFEAHPLTVFLTDVPEAIPAFRLVVCDPTVEPRTHFPLARLPELRRVVVESLSGRYEVLATNEDSEPGLRRLLADPFCSWLTGDAPAGLAWQLEGSHLCVWFPHTLTRREELDRGLEAVRAIAEQIAQTAERVAEVERRPLARRPVPAEPSFVPERWRVLAERRQLEYFPGAAGEDRTPIFRGVAYTTDTLAGEIADRAPGALSCVRRAVTSESAPPGMRTLDFLVATLNIDSAREVFPWITCVERTAKYRLVSLVPAEQWRPARALADSPKIKQESVRFGQRCALAASRAADRNQLMQLFSPAFLVWHLGLELTGFGWELENGALSVFIEGHGHDHRRVLALCDSAQRIAARIQLEVDERVL